MRPSLTTLMDFDVFLSHNSKDKRAVRELKGLLAANGLNAWLDEDELQPGIPWQQLLEAGIKNSKSVAVLIGKDGLGPWEDEEMQAALVLAVRDKRPCIPVLLPGASAKPELPMFLGNRTWVDLCAGFNEQGLAKLIWGITGNKPNRIARSTQPVGQGVQAIIAPTRLHHGADHLFGREEELAALDQLANDPSKKVLTIVAFGGIGKTSLVIEWMARQAAKNWQGFDRVFDWSFFSQGTREKGGPSADTFVGAALRFFGDEPMAQSAASAWDKGARLAQLVGQGRTLMVLDGVEPLQHPPGPLVGELKDPALATLLKGLARSNSGLCIVTTRERVADLAPFRETTAPEWLLQHLSIPAGVELLKTLGVRGTAAEFQQLVERVAGHALTLNLLGRYLTRAHGGDIRKRDQVKFEKADAATQGGYAFKTIGAYERWLSEGGENGARQLAVLQLLGLFDRPANAGCLAALRDEPVIAGLTNPLVGLDEEDWNLTLSSLSECGLVSLQTEYLVNGNQQLTIDAHPLIREYFAKRLREGNVEAWRSAHRRIYEHLTNGAEYQPDTLEALQPLYQAVAHGCLAGMEEDARANVYRDRILRGTGPSGFYSWKSLGAFGSNLAALVWFFEKPWSRLSASIPKPNHGWLLNETSIQLRALGRLIEALEPIRTATSQAVTDRNWLNALIATSNLSELRLTLGEVAKAVEEAEQSVKYADPGAEAYGRTMCRARLADALHQAGRQNEADTFFRQAEQIQADADPSHPLLYSINGFQYCDLLLASGERLAWRVFDEIEVVEPDGESAADSCDAVIQRAAQTLKWVQDARVGFLSVAVDYLTLGRAAFYGSILKNTSNDRRALNDSRQMNVANTLDNAVDDLRRSGEQRFLPLGLLTRCWFRSRNGAHIGPDSAQEDLDEAWEIVERGPMKLFMADIHLYRARLFHKVKPYPWNKNPDGSERGPKDDLADARRLIEQCGYWRRKEELEDAEEAAKNW